MDLSKVRGGELIAAIGGIVLLVALLFLNWYGVGISVRTPLGNFSAGGDFGAWDGQRFLGTLANLVILAAGVAAVALAFLTAASRTVALPVAASAMTAGLGIGAVVMTAGRMLFQPGPNEVVDLKFGIFLALAGALAVAYGGWQSMQEEGTTFDHARDQLQASLGQSGPDTERGRTSEPPGTGPGPGGTYPDAEAPIEPPPAPPPSDAPGPPSAGK